MSRIVAAGVCAVLVVATAVAAVVGFSYDARQRETAETGVRRAALKSLTGEFDGLLEATRQVGALFAASDDVTPAEFRTITEPLLSDGTASAFGWVPHVAHADRAAWERRNHARITRVLPTGELEVVGPRRSYDPLALVETAARNKVPLGLDAGVNPILVPALRASGAQNAPVSTPVTMLKPANVPGVFVLAPVRVGDGKLLGSVMGTFRIRGLIAEIDGLLPNGAAFELRQAGRRIGGRGNIEPTTESSTIEVAGQRWEVLTSAAPAGRLGNGVIALLVGGLISALVLLTLFVLARDAGRAERKAAQSEERFAQAFEHAPVGMALLDRNGRHVKVNEALAAMQGRTVDELMQLTAVDVLPASETGAARSLIEALFRGDQRYFAGDTSILTGDGRRIRVSVHMSLLGHDPEEEPSILLHAVDVTEQRLAERRMRHLADHDPLTGLLNRRGFAAALQSQVAHARRYGASGALLMLDLDSFKAVNDALGHDAGDQLLVRVAEELRSCLRETDAIARLGGDEFAIVLPRETLDEATVVAEKVISRLRERRLGTGAPGLTGVTASIGIARFAGGEETGDDVLRDADLAMYSAKGAGRDRLAIHGRHAGAGHFG